MSAIADCAEVFNHSAPVLTAGFQPPFRPNRVRQPPRLKLGPYFKLGVVVNQLGPPILATCFQPIPIPIAAGK